MSKATENTGTVTAAEAAEAQKANTEGKGVQVSAIIPQDVFDAANKLRFKLEIENRGDLLRRAITEFVENHKELLTDAS